MVAHSPHKNCRRSVSITYMYPDTTSGDERNEGVYDRRLYVHIKL